jgi:hypothetical protein
MLWHAFETSRSTKSLDSFQTFCGPSLDQFDPVIHLKPQAKFSQQLISPQRYSSAEQQILTEAVVSDP